MDAYERWSWQSAYLWAVRDGKAAREELEKMAYDYEQLSLKLCETEERLAEAREIARELFAYLRLIVDPDVAPSGSYLRSLNEAWLRIRLGVRRALER